MRWRCDQRDSGDRAEDDEPWRLDAGDAPRGVEPQRRADSLRDRPDNTGKRVGIALHERAALLAPGDMDRAPHAPADDERGA